jgi:hypothetical protein
MQFPSAPLPLADVARNAYEIRFRPPAPAVGRIAKRTLAPLIVPRPVAGRTAPTWTEQRSGLTRRRSCRRIAKLAVWLDTRSGSDRRGHQRREGEAASNIDALA